MYIVYYRESAEAIETFEQIKIEGDIINGMGHHVGSKGIRKEDVKKIITAYGVQIYPEKKERLIQAFVK